MLRYFVLVCLICMLSLIYILLICIVFLMINRQVSPFSVVHVGSSSGSGSSQFCK